MASLQERAGRWQCQFFHRGKRHMFALGQVTKAEAEAKSAQVDYLLMRLKQRLIELPPGIGAVEFIRHDGKPPEAVAVTSPERLTLAGFFDRYLGTHRPSLERRTVEGIELHFKHLLRILGEGFPAAGLKLADLQRFVDARAKARVRGKPLSPATIR